ncbi:MAG: hypothetical protein A2351_08685 [Omnitrophica bacterium RIFOXYB12_FULL_50_7]|nr:MAG: hypothetical protein A2351_08685 [Omnitrophica bacterium RIFOXYB12_FULL_50_7]
MERQNCQSRSFKGLMVAQFLEAFNDNALKILVSLFAIRILSPVDAARFIGLVGALFIIPFIVFSPYAGFLADRFKKRNIIVITKMAEVLIMVFSLFAFKSGNLFVISLTLFLMASHSAFFSPSKYGILPEILDRENLSKGNGFLQMWTFLAIILGSAFGGQISHLFRENVYQATYLLIAFAIVGAIASFFITTTGHSNIAEKFKINAFKESLGALKEIRQNRWLFLTLIAICFFWFLGAVFQMNVLLYGKEMLHLSDSHASLLLVLTSIGIGVGSLLAGFFSEKKIEYGLVPLGAIGISLVCMAIGFNGQNVLRSFCLFLGLGCFSGVFIVPLNAYFQMKSPEDRRGKYLAASNIVTSACILLASAYLWLLGGQLKFNPAQLFFVLGVFSVGITIIILKILPEAFIRLFNWILAHSLYRIKVVGRENIPAEGGGLLVCNHVAYADPPLVLASLERPVRFLAYREIYNHPLVKPFARAIKTIPVSFKDPPKAILESLRTAREAVENGELVCIFAEGGLTRTGNMLSFKKGFEHIMKGLSAPIIPMCIDKIWGSIFSFENGKFFWKLPKAIPYPVTIVFGRPMKATSRSHEVREAVQEMTAEAFKLRGKERKKLHIAFIEEAKKHPFKFCMADSSGKKLNYLEMLASVLLISDKLFRKSGEPQGDNEKVGILLPASCGASLVNGALLFSGKVPVNLNFTVSKESLLSCIEQCKMRKIVTSKVFLHKAKLEKLDGMIFLEDLLGSVTSKEKLSYVFCALALPAFLIKRWFVKGDKKNVEDVATIIFSSGSTGRPKGVMLSHGNIFSNIEALYQILHVKSNDVIMGALPFFHSFGFTGTLCMPVGLGLGAVYHNNPLDAGTIGELVQKYKATLLMGTPTFLSAYVRKCTPEQFKSLRYVVAGAEKLKQALSEAFREKFGTAPFEGYGATELSPIVAMGVPDYGAPGEEVHQVGHKSGSVGHPIPGVAVKTVDPDTGELKSYDEEGLLLVKGPNVMLGYLGEEEKTREVLQDGWYKTGDMAKIDQDGFIHITDRLSRFSKIGGEMVPHIKIEEKILEILETVEPVCAVTSVPDEKRGERLAVLYKGELDINALWDKLNATDFPKLWIPKREDFFQVLEIPLLGSGKLDLKKIKATALEMKEKNTASARGAQEEQA